MSDGRVLLHMADGVASVVFDRPEARNAMTWAMYAQLGEICDQVQADPSVRLVTLRGAGKEAFVAGTDIEQFQSFRTGDEGVAYEATIEAGLRRLEGLRMPTVAVIEGWAIGGGLAIAAACDFRIATPGSRFGVPIAKTLGNCLSVPNLARLCSVFGMPRVRRMLMLAEILSADEALASGFLLQIQPPDELDKALKALCDRLLALAPVTQTVTKEALRRLVARGLPDDRDLIEQCYGSKDFHEGVNAFVARKSPVWTGL